MKYVNIFILSLIFAPLFSFSQKVTVSEPIVLRSDIAYELIGTLGGNTLVFRDKGTSFEVVAFNNQMEEAWSKDIELDDRQPKVIGLVADKAYFTVIYQFREKSHTIIKAHKYGPGANLIDSLSLTDLGYLFYNPGFELIRSDDRSKALVYFLEKQEMIKAYSIDLENLHLKWQAVLQPEEFNYYQNFRDVLVDNDGNMTLVLEKNNFRSKREEHHFEIHTYYGASAQLLKYDIPMPDKLTYDAYFTYDHLNDRLIAAGLYSDKNLGRADGYFYLSIPPRNHKEFKLTLTEFDEAFLGALAGKESDKTKGLAEASIQEIVLRLDGGVLLIGERERTYERRAAGMNRTFYDVSGRFAVDYYYDEVFVISIHPTGETHWKTVLHKKQYSQDDDGMYSSYFLFKTPSNLRFLFNDEIKYENTVSEYVLKGNGVAERNSLLSTENLKLRLRFRDAVQVNSSELIVPSERRNRLRLVRLEYY
ncbi:MAG: hypothetical protein H6557_15580 [Lewinellaceae bacterium]|nr:hypothetical protein [Phaeodactylibacter sp.]MCB9038037.1 hypothetical protein [Lewinellaceae bacterium]